MGQRREVIKHSAAVQAENSVSLLAKKCFNVFLANAFYDLGHKRKFEMPLADLIDMLEYRSNDIRHLKKSIEMLMTTVISWDIFRQDRQAGWAATTMLASVQILDGIVTYSYSSFLQERFQHPAIYARINLRTQNLFESKYAQSLWELAVDIYDEKRGAGETRWIELETYKRFLGLKPEAYPEYKYFSQRAIREPVAEINRLTNFCVSIEQKRRLRKVIALKVRVAMKAVQSPKKTIQAKASQPTPQYAITHAVNKIPDTITTNPSLLQTACQHILADYPVYRHEFCGWQDMTPASYAASKPIVRELIADWLERNQGKAAA